MFTNLHKHANENKLIINDVFSIICLAHIFSSIYDSLQTYYMNASNSLSTNDKWLCIFLHFHSTIHIKLLVFLIVYIYKFPTKRKFIHCYQPRPMTQPHYNDLFHLSFRKRMLYSYLSYLWSKFILSIFSLYWDTYLGLTVQLFNCVICINRIQKRADVKKKSLYFLFFHSSIFCNFMITVAYFITVFLDIYIYDSLFFGGKKQRNTS